MRTRSPTRKRGLCRSFRKEGASGVHGAVDDDASVRELEKRRQVQIDRFADCQRRKRNWISFDDVANWCSREGESIKQDEAKRVLALDALAKDFLAGEFDSKGRSQVLFLHPYTSKRRLTRGELQEIIEYDYDSDHGRSEYLPHCWLPRPMLAAWSRRYRLDSLPSFFAPPTPQDFSSTQSAIPKHEELVDFFRRHYGEPGAATNREDMSAAAERHYKVEIPLKISRAALQGAGLKGRAGRPRKSGK
jgi:hypothetical protein